MLKNESGFTLVEMLIVLMIISMLILLIVPHVSKKSANINEKGCEALVELVQAQVIAYEIDNKRLPDSLDVLENGYIEEEHRTCGNGNEIVMNELGEVSYEEK